MAAYPDIGLQCDIQPLTGPSIDIAVSGKPRGLDLTTVTAYRVAILHPLVTADEVATLRAFYAANKGKDNTLTFRGETYAVKFERAYSVRSINARYSDASTSMIGTIL